MKHQYQHVEAGNRVVKIVFQMQRSTTLDCTQILRDNLEIQLSSSPKAT
jgi:hypothetical protein